MTPENDQTYYQRRAEQQLVIASAAVDPSIKAIHLDLASRYATLRELAARDDLENGRTMMAQVQVGIGR